MKKKELVKNDYEAIAKAMGQFDFHSLVDCLENSPVDRGVKVPSRYSGTEYYSGIDGMVDDAYDALTSVLEWDFNETTDEFGSSPGFVAKHIRGRGAEHLVLEFVYDRSQAYMEDSDAWHEATFGPISRCKAAAKALLEAKDNLRAATHENEEALDKYWKDKEPGARESYYENQERRRKEKEAQQIGG